MQAIGSSAVANGELSGICPIARNGIAAQMSAAPPRLVRTVQMHRAAMQVRTDAPSGSLTNCRRNRKIIGGVFDRTQLFHQRRLTLKLTAARRLKEAHSPSAASFSNKAKKHEIHPSVHTRTSYERILIYLRLGLWTLEIARSLHTGADDAPPMHAKLPSSFRSSCHAYGDAFCSVAASGSTLAITLKIQG